MSLNMRNQIDKLIITAMDRFVWFVILVVATHLVAEMTRVTGGPSKINRKDVKTANDSRLVTSAPVQRFILYQDDEKRDVYKLIKYSHDENNKHNNNNKRNPINNNNKNNNNNIIINIESTTVKTFVSAEARTSPSPSPSPSLSLASLPSTPASSSSSSLSSSSSSSPAFNFSPLIENIFELPMITFLRATNNLLDRPGDYTLKETTLRQENGSSRRSPANLGAIISST